jgi:hypothetical protein
MFAAFVLVRAVSERNSIRGGVMVRTFALIAVLAFSPALSRTQAPGGPERPVTVVMAGAALSSGAVQEGLMLGIPWADFGYQLFPRENVRVRMEYYWRSDKVVTIEEDAKKRGFDYERARSLLERSGIVSRRPSFAITGDMNRAEVKRAAYWLRDQLRRLGLVAEDNVRQESLPFLVDQQRLEAVLEIRDR